MSLAENSTADVKNRASSTFGPAAKVPWPFTQTILFVLKALATASASSSEAWGLLTSITGHSL